MQRVEHTPAFLLHQRPWGDSGRIFELFSREHGRLSVFARGVRGANAKLAGVLQPFLPLLVAWAGRGESPRLTGAEFDTRVVGRGPMPQDRVMSAWYVSELVMSLTARHDPQPDLYDHYGAAMDELRTAPSLPRTLRTLGSAEALPALPDFEFVLRRRHGCRAAEPLAAMILSYFHHLDERAVRSGVFRCPQPDTGRRASDSLRLSGSSAQATPLPPTRLPQ